MNYSIYGADRMTHLKIVVVALIASTGIASLGIAAHFKTGDRYSQTSQVIKANKSNLEFAAAWPVGRDTLPNFVNGSPAPFGTQIK